ncbi:tetraacyldisaccharide 4'-kinase [Planctomicrobium piriforme]|uniref:Tetraacyldisaccharide 4'-kinase n=1 Tax=Planctomicrobium piriforme TaxID=1576369 RepID=A0A1I3T3F0_9PLAN|nr:tetraacyldisaccharide 4'-kinase [Planctomicrobium piriforme]SFJ65688.1 tetraacyldisaccharide 4'-kinase [Planctomicrobium piriforme]
MNRDFYFDTISGRSREWQAELARLALAAATVPYGIATELRNAAFNCGLFPIKGVSVPVISIGNLTVGGTGKTPTVAWLVNTLSARGCFPAIISRGYRALDDSENDEKKLLDSLCPGVPHLQQPDRLAASRRALSSTPSNVLILDDAFQHRRMHRDLDIVLIDSLNPWGYNWLLPRGLMRESPRQLTRADVILLTRCDLAEEKQLAALQKRIARRTSAPILKTAFAPTGCINSLGETLPLDALSRHKVYAFCGIGNPGGFRKTISAFTDISDDRFRAFPDHHHYVSLELNRLSLRGQRLGVDMFLTTRKDLVKLPQPTLQGRPVWALEIELTFLDDPAPLYRLLQFLLPAAPFPKLANTGLTVEV